MDINTAFEKASKKKEVKIARQEWRDSEGNLEQYLLYTPEKEVKPLFGSPTVTVAHWSLVQLYVEMKFIIPGVKISDEEFNADDWEVV